MSPRGFRLLAILFLLLEVGVGRQNEVLGQNLDPRTAQRASGFVTTNRMEVLAPDGQRLLLRGINLGNWLVPEGYMFKFDTATSPRLINDVLCQLVGSDEARKFWKAYRDTYITRDDIQFIRRIGLNSVRIPFNWRLFVSEEDPAQWSGPGLELLERVVSWCREAGVWVILDMHCAPGGQTGDNIDDSWGYPFLFESEESQNQTGELWKRIAFRFRDERTIIGYDLLNEPIATFYDPKVFNPLLEPLYKRIVAAIRSVDTNHVVFLGGAQWDTNFGVFGPPFDHKIVYTFHKYWCDTTQTMVQEYVDFRAKYDVPIWMGESGENTDRWIAGWRRLQERNNIGWCFWPYKKMDSPSCLMTFDRPDGWSQIVRFAQGARATFKDVRLTRPPKEVSKRILYDFVKQCQFRNCRTNTAYGIALGISDNNK